MCCAWAVLYVTEPRALEWRSRDIAGQVLATMPGGVNGRARRRPDPASEAAGSGADLLPEN